MRETTSGLPAYASVRLGDGAEDDLVLTWLFGVEEDHEHSEVEMSAAEAMELVLKLLHGMMGHGAPVRIPEGHDPTVIELVDGGFVAACGCGWSTEPVPDRRTASFVVGAHLVKVRQDAGAWPDGE